MRPLLCLLVLASTRVLAQEEHPGGEEPSEGIMQPGSDSPEAVHPHFEGSRRRAQAFLIPMDEKARAPTARVAQAVEGVLSHTRQYEVVDLGRALSVESTAEEALRADEGRRLVVEGDRAAKSKGFPEAAGDYQRALKAFDKGLAAVGAREYAEALLRVAAAEWMSGEEKQAKEAFALAAQLDPLHKLEAARVEASVEPQLAAARSLADAARAGTLEVETRPAGARVQIDGEARGSSPVHVQLPGGKHLVRIERAGFYPFAELVEVAPKKPVQVSVTLSATPTASTLNQIIAGAAEEVGKGTAGKSSMALAEKFSLDRVLVGSVRTLEGKVSVLLSLVDANKQQLLGTKTLLLVADGTDADQIEPETQAAVQKLIYGEEEAAAKDGAAPPKAAGQARGDEPGMPKASAAALRAPVMPGSAPSADDPGLVNRERRVAMPGAPMDALPAPTPVEAAPSATPSAAAAAAAAPPAEARPPPAAEAPAPASTEETKKTKKRKEKGLKGKSGTEGWDDN